MLSLSDIIIRKRKKRRMAFEKGGRTVEIIKEDVFRKQLKKGLTGGYLFFGDEDYLKTHALRAAREAVCPDPGFALFNDVRLDALDYTPSALMDALMPPPMMGEQKIVSVTGLSLSSMRSSEIDDLCEVVATLPDYDYNVLILSIPAGEMEEGTPKKPSSVLQKLGKYLTPVSFDSISGARLAAWVGKHFAAHGVTAAPDVCSFLIEYSGKAMYTLSFETEKLSFYVLQNGRTTVTREDVKNVAIGAIEADAFALTNAILDGRSAEALAALSVMKFRRIDPIIVLSEVSRALCDLLSVKTLQEQGMPQGEIARALKMNEYKARLYANGASSKPRERLARALTLCADADLALKLSPQGYMAIENLICGL